MAVIASSDVAAEVVKSFMFETQGMFFGDCGIDSQEFV